MLVGEGGTESTYARFSREMGVAAKSFDIELYGPTKTVYAKPACGVRQDPKVMASDRRDVHDSRNVDK